MYKIITSILLLVSYSVISKGQAITLTADAINPVITDEFVVFNCDPTSVEAGSGGAGMSWDFSSLHLLNPPGAIDTGIAIDPSGTQAFAIFSASNLAISNPGSSLYAYYIESDSALVQNGLYISPLEYTAYSDPMDQLQFPFTYTNTFTDDYSGLVVYTPSGSPTVHAINTGSITVTADGYGSLLLPGSTSPAVYQNTLRVHSIQTYADSVNLYGTPIVGTYTVETFTWYTLNYHNILLTIATSTGPGVNSKQVSYSAKKLVNITGVSTQNPVENSLKLYPNPASSELTIAYNTPASEKVTISLTDVLGREIAVIANNTTQGPQQISYNTSALAKGIYFVHLSSGKESITRKVEVQ